MSAAKTKKRTIEQRREVACVDHGHPRIVSMCFGYVHCARCDRQIGDTLGVVFDASNSIVLGHECDECRAIACELRPDELLLLPDDVLAAVTALRAAHREGR